MSIVDGRYVTYGCHYKQVCFCYIRLTQNKSYFTVAYLSRSQKQEITYN